ncbi:uncharacterized protein PITG_05765 [Phytophthora infestans T30-4]|uniref:Uncharacterized protein n=1 Tax=Phytophthora infestans (strain T30-4) TaxID=403677 RepID=D0N5M6_PHYIT|nr:uncharacterized protein PITG_05765 [Phytophthora infestans T30-4]EEY70367.1 conserved hypothetical protein [Phytophthora infestans T30-4]|eukprot:XP_002998021.1 conserved hypothetical protein [Phytophthora infestans T30-4]
MQQTVRDLQWRTRENDKDHLHFSRLSRVWCFVIWKLEKLQQRLAPSAATLVAVRAQAAMAAAIGSVSGDVGGGESAGGDGCSDENLMQFRPLQRKKQSVNEKLSTATGPPMKLEPDVKRRKTS